MMRASPLQLSSQCAVLGTAAAAELRKGIPCAHTLLLLRSLQLLYGVACAGLIPLHRHPKVLRVLLFLQRTEPAGRA
jgi:hypothetical protein